MLWMEMKAFKAIENKDTACIHIAVALINVLISYILSLVWTRLHLIGSSSRAAGGTSSVISVEAFQLLLQAAEPVAQSWGAVTVKVEGIPGPIQVLLAFPYRPLVIPLEVGFGDKIRILQLNLNFRSTSNSFLV